MSDQRALVRSWAADRAHKLMLDANRVDNAYTRGKPLGDACNAYAEALRDGVREFERSFEERMAAIDAAMTRAQQGGAG